MEQPDLLETLVYLDFQDLLEARELPVLLVCQVQLDSQVYRVWQVIQVQQVLQEHRD